MEEFVPSDRDIAFMGAVDVVLRGGIQPIAREHAIGTSNMPGEQEVQDRVMQLVCVRGVFDETLAGAYGDGDGFARFCQDCKIILTRFLSRYQRDKRRTLALVSFIEKDLSPSKRARYIELLRAAYVSARCGADLLPADAQERELYALLRTLFIAGEGEERSTSN